MEEYKCINFDECGNIISYNERGRKPIRCKDCQDLYSKKLRRDAYRRKVKDRVKITKCGYKNKDGHVCGMSIPYVTNKPQYCPKHARKARLDWMRHYYTGDKVVYCQVCKRPIEYETKKPDLCTSCRNRQKINEKRAYLSSKKRI